MPDPTDPTGRRGLGRICELDHPLTVREFAARAAERLPATAQGIRVAGDPEALSRTVAVSGGSGDSLFDRRPRGRRRRLPHRGPAPPPGSEARSPTGPLALLDAAHWATEWPWCELAAAQLDEISDRHGWDLRVHVSKTVTDPWSSRGSPSPGAPN